jgi:hypothetical protein
MRTIRTSCILFLLTLSPILLNAQQSGFGLGFIIGEPTGISFKGFLAEDRAIAGAVAWRLWRGNALHVHADYLFHNRTLIGVPRGSLPLYYGVGVRLRSWTGGEYWYRGRYREYGGSRVDLGIRFPVGLAYQFGGAPLDIFLEVVPVLDLVPATTVEIGGAIGMRYWF